MERRGSQDADATGDVPGKTRTDTTTDETTTNNAAGVLAPEVLADLIRVTNSRDYAGFMAQVRAVGGCANPRHLRGGMVRRDASGRVVEVRDSRDRPGGVVLVACRNRREAVCPSCSKVYRGDVFALALAGMSGGKGVPDSVASHVRVFVTLTAPSFGAVHTHRVNAHGRALPCHPRRTGECGHGTATSCLARHGQDDPEVGAPLCARCYDYASAVIWQASMGRLWQHFTIYTSRHLARVAGITHKELRAQVRLSYVKIAEFQRRGVVHVHAVIRADGTGDQAAGEVSPAPDWVTADLIASAVRSAVATVRVKVAGGLWVLGWGGQLDVQEIPTVAPDQVREDSVVSVAAYVAKYATKSTEATGWTGTGFDGTPRAEHARRMIATAVELSEVPALADLKLGRWARTLGFRGHVSSKSRRYSTTLTALRAERATWRRRQLGLPTEQDDAAAGITAESAWRLAGIGYTPGQAFLAAQVADEIAPGGAAAQGAASPGGWAGLRGPGTLPTQRDAHREQS